MTLPKGFGSGRYRGESYDERQKRLHRYPDRPKKYKKTKTSQCENCGHYKDDHKGFIRKPCKICMCPNFKTHYTEILDI